MMRRPASLLAALLVVLCGGLRAQDGPSRPGLLDLPLSARLAGSAESMCHRNPRGSGGDPNNGLCPP